MDAARMDMYRIMANGIFDAVNAQYWDGDLPKIPIRISNRMKKAAGGFRYRLATSKYRANITVADESVSTRGISYNAGITLSASYLEKGFANEVLVETLKHEIAHLIQFITRGVVDHGRDFKDYCAAMECSTATYHSIGEEDDNGEFIYFCPVCGDITRYKRRVDKSDGGMCNHSGSENTFKKQFVGRATELKRVLPALTAELFAEDFVREAASTVEFGAMERTLSEEI